MNSQVAVQPHCRAKKIVEMGPGAWFVRGEEATIFFAKLPQGESALGFHGWTGEEKNPRRR